MPAKPLSTATAALLIATIVAMSAAAALDHRLASMIAAAVACLTLIFAAVALHGRHNASVDGKDQQHIAASDSARLMGIVYGWGGLAMLSVYLLSGLSWRHGWQYGSGMLLIAAGLFLLARALGDQHSRMSTPRLRDLTALVAGVQAVAATMALAILVYSGKLATPKGDWAANHIFMAGGLAIIVVSALAVVTHRRLRREA